jgi:tetratricopeptide (TPR) repeat protein
MSRGPVADDRAAKAGLRALARQRADAGDLRGAGEAFRQLVALDAGDADALLQLSYLESLQGRYRAAREFAMRAAAAVDPANGAVLRELASRLRTFNEVPLLFACVERHVATGAPDPGTLLVMAAQLSNLNEQERALALLDLAMAGGREPPAALALRGSVLTFLGRFEAAERDLARCLQLAPGMAQAYWALSRLRKASAGANLVAPLRERLAGRACPPGDLPFLGFALHKELDDLGEYAQAAAALENACKAKRSQLRYATADSRRLVDALVRQGPDPKRGHGQSDTGGAASPVPVFIVGLHRSGTTLLEQLLSGHPDVAALGELYDFTSQMREATDHHCRGVIDETIVARAAGLDLAPVGRGYLRQVDWRTGGKRWFTDKLPSNFLNLGYICAALPGAKILHMVREPVEVCFSNLRELFAEANPYSYEQREMAAYHRQYQRLMAHWHAQWGERILDIRYDALTRDPEGELRRVAAFCGFAFDPAMLALQASTRGVSTASAVQVRQGIVARDAPKWKPYEAWLQPLIEALGS